MIDSVIRTQIQVTKSLTAITDNGSARYALGCVQVTPSSDEGRVHLAVTDGRIGAVIESEGMSDEQRLVPQEVLPTRKGDCEISLNGRWLTSHGKHAEHDDEGRYPHLSDCFPNIDAGETITLRLNADLLAKLAEAVGKDDCNSVSLHFQVPSDKAEYRRQVSGAVAVSGRQGVGVIMPCPDGNRTVEIDEYNVRRNRYAEADSAARRSS